MRKECRGETAGPLGLIFVQELSEPEGTLERTAPDSLTLLEKPRQLKALSKLPSPLWVDVGLEPVS